MEAKATPFEELLARLIDTEIAQGTGEGEIRSALELQLYALRERAGADDEEEDL